MPNILPNRLPSKQRKRKHCQIEEQHNLSKNLCKKKSTTVNQPQILLRTKKVKSANRSEKNKKKWWIVVFLGFAFIGFALKILFSSHSDYHSERLPVPNFASKFTKPHFTFPMLIFCGCDTYFAFRGRKAVPYMEVPVSFPRKIVRCINSSF